MMKKLFVMLLIGAIGIASFSVPGIAAETEASDVIVEEAEEQSEPTEINPLEEIQIHDEEEYSEDIMIGGDEEVITEDIEVQDVGPLEENPEPDLDAEPILTVQGSVDGSSKITWTSNTMPVAFDITSLSLRKYAYLTATQKGYMRVGYDGTSIIVEYYDEGFHMTKQGRLPMELPVWGGFYEGDGAYYIVEGQYNTDCIDGTEVLRIIKYDFNWNRIGAGNILAQEGWEYEIRYPFDVSCVNMTEVNGKLYVVTGREGYVDPQYGQGHQGMMLIRMDEDTFDTEIAYGDFWHSFAQYIDHNGTDLYICEQSEGSRCTTLSRFDANRTDTDYFDAFSDSFSVFDYGGAHTSAWAIACYASVDDMVISRENVLCLGTSIDQSQYSNVTSDTPHNIYLTVTPISDLGKESTTVKWLTDYSGEGKSFIGVNITKINDDRFLVMWEESPDEDANIPLADNQDTLSSGLLHYVFVDGAGNTISKEFTAPAMISQCKPIINGNRVVYFASNANCLDFYSIDAKTGEFKKSVKRIAGDNISWDFNNGNLSFTGKGNISIDNEAHYRYPLSSTAGVYAYSSSDNCWMSLRDNVTGINIGKGITSIPEGAFAWFANLTNVNLPDGLKSIGKEAFYVCDSLREIAIPDSVSEIGDDFLWIGSYWIGDESHVTFATIYANCTSYAIKYAKANNISYRTPHKWDSGKITKKATAIAEGEKTYTCVLCGETKTESIPMIELEHEYMWFYDVNDSSTFYYEPVYWASGYGIVKGWTDRTFRPWNTCNRAAVVTFLWRMDGKPEPKAIASFRDMPDNSSANQDFRKAISWAVEQGITTGWDDNTFRPWRTCNRAAIMTFIWRYVGKPKASKSKFKDLTGNADFDTAIAWASENGIATGYKDGTFGPWKDCNRASVAAFLYRYANGQ